MLRLIRSLRFQEDLREEGARELETIPEREWPKLLELSDRSQLTLPLGVRCRDFLPDPIRRRIDANLSDNRERHARLQREYLDVAGALQAASLDFVLLKGFSQFPHYAETLDSRPQFDIDIFCPSPFVKEACAVLRDIGYVPAIPDNPRTDHLPAMIRDTQWQWRGNYHAVDLPLTVELHFRFWDAATERFDVPKVDRFWERRVTRQIGDIAIPTLDLADGISYSALHLVRHLLRGDLKIYHVYELAHFLHQSAHDDAIWHRWHQYSDEVPSAVEAIAFRLARDWFACEMHPLASAAVEELPAGMKRWFVLFPYSPILALERPNKDELLLHLNLVKGAADRMALVTRRMLPVRVPKMVRQSSDRNWRLRRIWFIAKRAKHHVRTLAPLMRSLIRWKTARAF